MAKEISVLVTPSELYQFRVVNVGIKTAPLMFKRLTNKCFIFQYEINFLELIKRRRARIGYTFKKEEVEYAIVNRIHGLFRRALTKWKGDIQLWLSHIAFCKKWNAKVKLSKVFSAMLAIHPNKPALWIMAAKWEMEDCLSSENARHLFLRALRFHPDSQKVYQEYFRMELMNAEKIQKEKQLLEVARVELAKADFPMEILRGQLARVVYKRAIEKVAGNAEFHLSFWTIAANFNFTQELQKEIVEDLQTLHTNHTLTWDFLARRELDTKSLPTSECSKQAKASDIARKEERCWAVYEEAVLTVPTEAVWKCYITFCLERFKRKTNNAILRKKRLDKVLSVFDRASESSLLPQALYKQWIEMLVDLGDAEKAVRVVKASSSNFGQSVDLWQSSLELLMKLQSADVTQLFQQAFRQVPHTDCLPLWLLRLEWSESTSSVNETETLYQRTLQTPIPAVSMTVKEKYLDWALKTGGYKKAWKVFTSLHENRPFSLEYFKKMIAIEKEQDFSKMKRLRDCYELALREFGTTSADLWLEYIEEEWKHPKGEAERTGHIHWRAMKTLGGLQVERFVSQYTLLQTGNLQLHQHLTPNQTPGL
ncbi:U3 small nucleolar RNA-associated protein 6 homolog [Scyliorhinus canicula]|uniref:U3 small nucleolar RNA-associated protein 6 homolog n=1 Tax=Scyliorhinus canicula TaxID=7830 RepID=UPI0018F28984|nr:U3 small nucleolar RNA-associated protein 6 homolog [Scyliorhinus canicula]